MRHGQPGARGAREGADARAPAARRALRRASANEGEREALERLARSGAGGAERQAAGVAAERRATCCSTRVQPQMAVLGPKLGKLLPKMLAALRAGDMQAQARSCCARRAADVGGRGPGGGADAGGGGVEASAREGFVAAEERGYVALLETTLTPELVAEGLVRDLTHLIQDVRKRAGLAIEDTIDTGALDRRRVGAGDRAARRVHPGGDAGGGAAGFANAAARRKWDGGRRLVRRERSQREARRP